MCYCRLISNKNEQNIFLGAACDFKFYYVRRKKYIYI